MLSPTSLLVVQPSSSSSSSSSSPASLLTIVLVVVVSHLARATDAASLLADTAGDRPRYFAAYHRRRESRRPRPTFSEPRYREWSPPARGQGQPVDDLYVYRRGGNPFVDLLLLEQRLSADRRLHDGHA